MMRSVSWMLILAAGLLVPGSAVANSCEGEAASVDAARLELAVSEDKSRSLPLEELRRMGEAGLWALLKHPPVAAARLAPESVDEIERGRIAEAVDAVAGQKDALAAGLFWYTDWEQALAEAERLGRPVLSLRLLGELTSDLSCANSRFFRATLYADPELACYLRNHLVLHWETVRPVPVITVNFGNGRTIRRTITGNSIHYVTDARGRVVDGLPGLYDADTFASKLRAAEQIASSLQEATDEDFVARLGAWHLERKEKLEETLLAVGWEKKENTRLPGGGLRPAALFHIDDPLVEVLSIPLTNALAAHISYEPVMSEPVQSFVKGKHNPDAQMAGMLTVSKRFVENPLLRSMRNLQQNIGGDTLQNEYVLHRTLHGWISRADSPYTIQALNDSVYSSLFLMPLTDQWLGLAPPDAFSGLDHDGKVEELIHPLGGLSSP